MFPNLRAEMARRNLLNKDISDGTGISYESLKNKLNGRSEFKRQDMYLIKNKFFPNYTIDYLFYKSKDKDVE